jgi:hypothetical protein
MLAPSPIGASMESLGNVFGLIHMYGKEQPVQSLQLRQNMHPVYLYIQFLVLVLRGLTAQSAFSPAFDATAPGFPSLPMKSPT